MRWKQRPKGSTWGNWGADDELGRANLLDAQAVLRGVREVREGRVFCLSLPLDHPSGEGLSDRRGPPRLRPTCRGSTAYFDFPLGQRDGSSVDVVCDDEATLALQFSTQWDALSHVGARFDADGDGLEEQVYYNGFRMPAAGAGAASPLGVQHMAVRGMQGRGVLLDLVAHHGHEGVQVGYDELMRVIEADGVELEPGDMLLLRTGFADELLARGASLRRHELANACCALDGRDDRLLRWIADSGIAALAADNPAVERYPGGEGAPDARGRRSLLPLHHHCLFKLGLPLGELWHLGPLADWLREHRRSRFLLTAPPLRLPGAAGSPLTPIATV